MGNFLLSAKTPNLDSTKMPECSFSAQIPPFLETFDIGDCVLQELGSPFKKIMPFAATWMDLEIIILSDVSQTKTNIIYHLYVKSKNMIEMNLFKKQKQTHRLRK